MSEPEKLAMTASTTAPAERDLSGVELALVDTIKHIDDPRPSTVIPAVVSRHPGEDVRGAYWKLVSSSVVTRELNGRLAVNAR